ncbi:hypothetical protein B566_EDAN012861 [Ephemera danica]|nr:hypothetical protein B566_EDAN012861 [Ephemera danica]
MTYEGIVSKVMLKQVQLRFSERFEPPKPDDTYLVLFMLNRNSYRRLHAAVEAAWANLGPSLLFPSTKITLRTPQIMIEDAITPDEKLAVPNSHLSSRGSSNSPASRGAGYRGRGRGILRGDNPRSRMNGRGPQNEQPKEESHIQTVPHLKKICFINDKLNSSQRAAVRNVLLGRARPLPYIIYGPPATPSNSAADLLAERLLDSGKLMPGAMVRLLAISYEDNVTPRLIPYSRVLKGIGELRTREQPLVWERIVIGTCATLGKLVQNSRESGGSHFTHILLDEAGQTTEPETMLVAALLGKPYQTILAGDPMQLGPVVQGRASELGGFGVSFLGRLLGQGPYRRDVSSFPSTQGYNPHLITMLVQNYRSIPEILALPAALFYNSELVATVSQHQGEEASLLAAMKDELPQRPGQVPPALVFHGVRGVCNREEDSPSWYNDIELYQAAKYIATLYRKGVPHNQIGVISPYNKQVQKMRTLLCKMGLDIPKVGSVEEFQGQERMAIIFSAVRSAENCGEEALGFLANPNRMNTAVTRARALLVVIGDPHLLAMDPSWRSLIIDCIRRNAYCGCDVPSSLLTTSSEGSQ